MNEIDITKNTKNTKALRKRFKRCLPILNMFLISIHWGSHNMRIDKKTI